MKKLAGCILGLMGFSCIVFLCGVRDFDEPFWRNAVTFIALLILAVDGIVLSLHFLIEDSKSRGKKNLERLMKNRRAKLVQQCANIIALKK